MILQISKKVLLLMSQFKLKQSIKFKLNLLKTKIKLNIKDVLFALPFILFTIPIILIYLFVLKRRWFDGLSIAAVFFIGISLLCIFFNKAKFNHFLKIKNFFIIKKENKEEFTKFEKQQMNLLNINFKKNFKHKKKNKSLIFHFTLLIYGIIILIISIPFLILN